MSGYSLFRQITPTDSNVNFPLESIVANQRTQISVISADDSKFQPFLRVNNPNSVEVASGETKAAQKVIFTPIVGGTFTGIVRDNKPAAAATELTAYTVEVNLEPNDLNNERNGDTPAVNPGTYSGWVGKIDPIDYYRIEGPSLGKLTATLGNLDGIVTANLVDPSNPNFPVATTQNNKGQPDAKLEFEVLTPGKRYFLEVKHVNANPGAGEGQGKNNSSKYNLNLAFATSTTPTPVVTPPTPVVTPPTPVVTPPTPVVTPPTPVVTPPTPVVTPPTP
ncbi:MAG: hypothetical protein ACBR12_24440, partial [Microcoleus sp.]